MRFVKRLAKPLLRVVFNFKAEAAIARLSQGTNQAAKSLAYALQETLHRNISPEETAWIERIESLRKELNSSTATVSLVDYGAGDPSQTRTDQDMYQGRFVTMTIGEVCRGASKPYVWSLLLFKLIRKLRSSACLELGTCLGVSGSFQAAALKLNGTGKIITLEGAESLADLAEKNFQRLGLDNVVVVKGRFQDTLKDVLNKYSPLSYAFIDGHHDEKATLDYFDRIAPHLSETALVVFDDISWSEGMKRAWERIKSDDRVRISVDLREVGVCLFGSGIAEKSSYKLVLL